MATRAVCRCRGRSHRFVRWGRPRTDGGMASAGKIHSMSVRDVRHPRVSTGTEPRRSGWRPVEADRRAQPGCRAHPDGRRAGERHREGRRRGFLRSDAGRPSGRASRRAQPQGGRTTTARHPAEVAHVDAARMRMSRAEPAPVARWLCESRRGWFVFRRCAAHASDTPMSPVSPHMAFHFPGTVATAYRVPSAFGWPSVMRRRTGGRSPSVVVFIHGGRVSVDSDEARGIDRAGSGSGPRFPAGLLFPPTDASRGA